MNSIHKAFNKLYEKEKILLLKQIWLTNEDYIKVEYIQNIENRNKFLKNNWIDLWEYEKRRTIIEKLNKININLINI
jgi:hypothetical protein